MHSLTRFARNNQNCENCFVIFVFMDLVPYHIIGLNWQDKIFLIKCTDTKNINNSLKI